MDYFLISLKPLLFTGSSLCMNNAKSGILLGINSCSETFPLKKKTRFLESRLAACIRERVIITRKPSKPLSWESWAPPTCVGKPQQSIFWGASGFWGDPSGACPTGDAWGSKACWGDLGWVSESSILCFTQSPSTSSYFTTEICSEFEKKDPHSSIF